LLLIYKGKGDPMEYGSYREIVTGTYNESDKTCLNKGSKRN